MHHDHNTVVSYLRPANDRVIHLYKIEGKDKRNLRNPIAPETMVWCVGLGYGLKLLGLYPLSRFCAQ